MTWARRLGACIRPCDAVRYVLTVLGILLVIGALGAVKGAQIAELVAFGKEMKRRGPPPEAVGTRVAEEQQWESVSAAVGTVATAKGVAVAGDVPGTIVRIRFDSGQAVRKGQPLVELDASVERSQLATARARDALAATTWGRSRRLAASGAISRAERDADESALHTSTSEVETIEAQIERKTIRAPFTGKLGIRLVNVGQYLAAGAPVTEIQTGEPVHVDFTLPQQFLEKVKTGMRVRVRARRDAGAPIEGVLAAIEPSVDPATRAVRMRADVRGDDGRLRPGMFVEVDVVQDERERVLAVPATAIVHAPYGDSVFVVEPKAPDEPGMRETPDGRAVKTARQQFVKVGAARGDFVAVVDGVRAGQVVVTSGSFKLRNGSPVVVDDGRQPVPEQQPHPENR